VRGERSAATATGRRRSVGNVAGGGIWSRHAATATATAAVLLMDELCTTVQCSAVQCSALQCSAV
jgi:hypothetical protein